MTIIVHVPPSRWQITDLDGNIVCNGFDEVTGCEGMKLGGLDRCVCREPMIFPSGNCDRFDHVTELKLSETDA